MIDEAINEKGLDWMPKSVWGPIKWKELHARGLVDRPMAGEDLWFADYIDGLPCPKCRKHFEEFLRDHPPDFSSRQEFFTWSVAAHNFVNHALGRRLMSVDEAFQEHHFKPDPKAE